MVEKGTTRSFVDVERLDGTGDNTDVLRDDEGRRGEGRKYEDGREGG